MPYTSSQPQTVENVEYREDREYICLINPGRLWGLLNLQSSLYRESFILQQCGWSVKLIIHLHLVS